MFLLSCLCGFFLSISALCVIYKDHENKVVKPVLCHPCQYHYNHYICFYFVFCSFLANNTHSLTHRTRSWEQMLHTRSRSSVGSRTWSCTSIVVSRIQSWSCCMYVCMYVYMYVCMYVFIFLSHLKYTETNKIKTKLQNPINIKK